MWLCCNVCRGWLSTLTAGPLCTAATVCCITFKQLFASKQLSRPLWALLHSYGPVAQTVLGDT